MSYLPQGFTPEEETEILDSVRRTETIRTVTIVATVGGLLYTLARFGELVSDLRQRRARSPAEIVKSVAKGR